MAPVPSEQAIHSLTRRWTNCDYYDSKCNTHRTILLSIIISVLVLTVLILCLFWVRRYRRRAARARDAEAKKKQLAMQESSPWIYRPHDGAYRPFGAQPQQQARQEGGVERREGDEGEGERETEEQRVAIDARIAAENGLASPPPAYTREVKEMPVIR
jgi:hypothetical protein